MLFTKPIWVWIRFKWDFSNLIKYLEWDIVVYNWDVYIARTTTIWKLPTDNQYFYKSFVWRPWNWISNIQLISWSHSPWTLDTYRINFTDWTNTTFQVYNWANWANWTNWVSIVSIAKTAWTWAPWTTDTYTITLSNSTTSTFTVYNWTNWNNWVNWTNWTNWRWITSVTKTAWTWAPWTTDTYTILFTDSTTSTFTVYNWADWLISRNPITKIWYLSFNNWTTLIYPLDSSFDDYTFRYCELEIYTTGSWRISSWFIRQDWDLNVASAPTKQGCMYKDTSNTSSWSIAPWYCWITDTWDLIKSTFFYWNPQTRIYLKVEWASPTWNIWTYKLTVY